MHQNGSACVIVQFLDAADVIDVGVRANDGFDGEFVAAEQVHDAVNFVAGVEDQSFARDWIADDRAVALQHADGNGEVEQALAVFCGGSVRHMWNYNVIRSWGFVTREEATAMCEFPVESRIVGSDE